jgi:hypothetical protein
MQLSPLPDSSEHIWPDPTKIAGFHPDSSGSGQISAILAKSGWIHQDPAGSVVGSIQIRFGQISDRSHPNSAGSQPF